MPPTRREQLELDELLSDIYRGIETLPDKSRQQAGNPYATNIGRGSSSGNKSSGGNLFSRSYVQEYELPASSPVVKQHKKEIAALRNQQQQQLTAGAPSPANYNSSSNSNKQPQRSTLKRHSNTPDQASNTRQQPQSLASFVTSTTPENKRRVRIVDHPDKLAKGYNSSNDDYEDQEEEDNNFEKQQRKTQRANVKYVNTNKLIYHQEKNPGDEILSDNSADENNSQADDDDIDGVSRVEYYHTTWLDRQLGRASKRRSSKELNERQVKEKAMIEELKRSLKNGAITLRQSFKGKRNNNNNNNNNNHNNNSKSKLSETYDDQILDHVHDYHKHRRVKEPSRSVFGLATIPRNYNHSSTYEHYNTAVKSNGSHKSNFDKQGNDTTKKANSYKHQLENSTPKQTTTTTSDYIPNIFDSVYRPVDEQQPQVLTAPKQQQDNNYHSRTLPHNYQANKGNEPHQLLQSHYKGGEKNFSTINTSRALKTTPATITNNNNADNMRDLNYNSNTQKRGYKSPINDPYDHQQHQVANTISSIPSATEVVRSALSRSSSQTSLNQLNKTINLLPNSPPPYAPSPMSPTQQLKSPSPACRSPYQRQNSDFVNYNQQQQQQTVPTHTHAHQQYTSKTMGSPSRSQPQQHFYQQPAIHGARVINKPEQQQRQPQQYQQQQQQPVYANPHASLMQHRVEQQMKQPSRNNNASIREFNELDSLLRSLSPGSNTIITPGFNSKQAQPAFGYGFTPAPQQQPQQPPIRSNINTDIYAKVQKQPYHAPSEQSKASYLQQHYMANQNTATPSQPYTVDVTNKKDDDCLQRQDLSEFEPPTELLPSMEDYQNISKLNPVRNHYWYKPNMSRERAISLLKDKPQGTFIVRDSTSFKGAYGLAVKVAKLPKNVLNNASLRTPNADPSSELIRHFLIEPTSTGVKLKGYANESVYGSLPALIYQHSLTELALPCKLVIPRADIEDSNFNHKQKQFYDEFLASKEMAKHNPYDSTSPDGGYRKYPGNVYVHNEHRIIFE